MSGTQRDPGPGAERPRAYEPRIHLAIVSRVERLGPGMVRVTLGGEDMRDYPSTGIGDEYVRLFFPDQPDERVRMPVISDTGWDFAEGVEPSAMRTYTIRAHRVGEVDIDFVEHDGGIAAAWAAQARPGYQLAINPPRPLYDRPAWAKRQVLVADEPALPAALRIAEHERVSYTWLDGTGNAIAASRLVEALRQAEIDERSYVWTASETRLSREARRYLRHELGLQRDAYKCVGYWTDHAEEWSARYDSLGPGFQQRVESLYSSARDEEEIADDVEQLLESVGL